MENASKRTFRTEVIPCYCKCERAVGTEERRIKVFNLIMKFRTGVSHKKYDLRLFLFAERK